jgi:hypothetical protein
MRWAKEKHGLVCYLQESPEAPNEPITGVWLAMNGWEIEKGGYFSKDNASIRYDGLQWWCYYWCAEFRINTIEELQKLLT